MDQGSSVLTNADWFKKIKKSKKEQRGRDLSPDHVLLGKHVSSSNVGHPTHKPFCDLLRLYKQFSVLPKLVFLQAYN